MIKVLLFDFDGTIADSFAVVQEVFYELTGAKKIEDPVEVERLRRMPMLKAAQELEIKPWQLPRLMIRGRALMGKRIAEIKLFPGMDAVIRALHDEGYQMFVMTSNSASNVQEFLRSYHLDKYFIRVYGNIGLLGKTGAIRSVARHNHFSTAECAYIGDEARDIIGARKAGAFTISVDWGYNDRAFLQEHNPDAIVHSPADLLTVLENSKRV